MSRSMRKLVAVCQVLLASTGITLITLVNLQPLASAQDISISSARNCDANAVVNCGAGSVSQLQGKYKNGDGRNSAASIQAIYNHFGISAADIADMSKGTVTVESGLVTSDGNVLGDKNNNLLATGAVTAGRQDMPGSTRHQSGSTVFFTRPPSVSFLSHALPAFVVIRDGKFAFAVLASCGNPVIATAKPTPQPTPAPQPKTQPKPTPQPTPTPPAPQPTTVNICSGNNTSTTSNVTASAVSQGNCNTSIVNNTVVTPGTPTCDQLGISQGDNRTVTINSFMTTANGASFTSANVNWGDNTLTTGVANPIGLQHQFTGDGTFTITVTAHFMVNGQDTPITSSACQQQVSFNTLTPTVPPATTTAVATPTTPATPAPAQTLVNTGPGDVIGIFAVATAVSTLGYRLFLMRRLTP